MKENSDDNENDMTMIRKRMITMINIADNDGATREKRKIKTKQMKSRRRRNP
jgi:hypothetical protein